MKLIVLIVVINLINLKAYSQSFLKKLTDAIEIKKSFENPIDRNKPATVNFSIPAGQQKYYAINGGIAISPTLLTTGNLPSKTTFDFFAVFNRNNQIKNEQNTFKTGLSVNHKMLFIKDKFVPRNLKLNISFSNEYLNNKIDRSHNFLSLLYVTPYFAIGKNLKFGLPVDDVGNKKIIPFLKLTPGVEYYNRFDAPTNETKGSLARLYMTSSINFLFRINKSVNNSDTLLNVIETGIDYTYRNDFYNNTGAEKGYLPLFNYTISIYPFSTNNIAFGATYLNGSDPVAGLSNQEYWLFEFKFKKNFK